MMKKCSKTVFAATVAAALVATMGASTVLADDTEHKTTVKYTVAQSYEWSVPSEITFTSDNTTVTADGEPGNQQKVKVSKNVIADGTKLQITAVGSGKSNAFTIQPKGKNNTLPYAIKVGNSGTELTSGGTVLEVSAGENAGDASLTFTLTKDSVEKAGEYEGSVTYTASVVNAN